MIPNKKQWQQWSLPSKYTTIGLILGVVSIFIGLASFFISSGENQDKINLKDEVKKAYREIRTDNKRKDKYIERYLKDRIAEIESIKTLEKNGNFVARIYYFSFWEKLTSTFRASVEIRQISDLNKKYSEEEGWGKAKLIQHDDDYEHTLYLGESEFVEIQNIEKDIVYEVRIVDFNYDSDEPPTFPFRFQVL